jgi:hypothetical protein
MCGRNEAEMKQPQVMTGIEREAQQEVEDVRMFWRALEDSFREPK